MRACVACPKHFQSTVEAMEEDGIPRSPGTREVIRSLKNQLKGIAVRFSAGAYRHCRPCVSPDPQHDGNCIDSMDITDASSEVSTSSAQNLGAFFSTPPRSFHKQNHGHSRKKGYNKGSSTKVREIARVEPVSPARTHNGYRSGYEATSTEDKLEKEWVAQVEPGVLITFVTLPDGGNELKRIRFSREMFNKWQAQQWWAENCEKVHELYNVPRFNRRGGSELPSPSRLKDERKTTPERGSRHGGVDNKVNNSAYTMASQRPNRSTSGDQEIGKLGGGARSERAAAMAMEGSLLYSGDEGASDTSDQAEVVRSNEREEGGNTMMSLRMSDQEMNGEWVEEDEPGVYLTLKSSSSGGLRVLKRVRFSRERFTEIQARLWWEENHVRIHEQYL